MADYLLSIAGISLISSVISLISPQRKFKNLIEGILKLCILLVVVSPVINFIGKSIDLNLPINSISSTEYIENGIILSEKQYLQKKYDITVEVYLYGYDHTNTAQNDKKMEIIITDFGMNSKTEHIHIKTAIEQEVLNQKLADTVSVKIYTETEEE